MKKQRISAFIPVRKGSERISDKNTKKFASFEGGLLELKILQLLSVNRIDEIIVSTNDENCISIATKLSKLNTKVKIDIRPEYLALSETDLMDLIKYVPSICHYEHILWSHVTSPLLDDITYHKAIEKYDWALNNGFDSLMTAKKLTSFIWDAESSEVINRKSELAWPRTQDLKAFYEVDSGIFLLSKELYSKYDNRMGKKPFVYETSLLQSLDVDWPEDFELAEKLYVALNETN